MKRKLLVLLLAALTLFACAALFAACGEGSNVPQHSHSWSQSWERNETHHWHNCTEENCPVTDNSQKDGYAEHDFSNGDCVCGQPKPHTHVWSQNWDKNETHHWHNCTEENCPVTDNSQKDGYAEHDFSNGNCVCGQPKPHTHVWSQSWEINDTHHWHNCTAENCPVTDNSQKDGYAEHDFSNGNCVCGQSKPTDGLAYSLNPDGKSYRVTGIGIATDTEIIIPASYEEKPVTRISNQAFQDNKTISKIVIPDSVTRIGNKAFYECSNLTSITIPDSVTSIGDMAFCGCSTLTSITLPDSLTSISDSAFNGCSSLTSITIPDSVTSIDDMAFRFCGKLTNITIPDSVTSIGDDIFEFCDSLNYNEYGNAYYLGNANNPYLILIDTKYTTIYDCNINSNTKFIYSYAFLNCSKLTRIIIPDGVTSIGSSAFRNCSSLANITIPDSVTRIGGRAFENISYYGKTFDNAYYLGTANNPYLILIKAKDTSITNCTINSNTKFIYYSAFKDCSNLTNITIPDGVTSIGGSAFRDCSKLASITIPDSVTSIDGSAFDGCSALTSIAIPDSVTLIDNSTFYDCSSLTSITIPDSVTSINDYAFYNCSSLTSITIPDSVTSIDGSAFEYCKSLTSINFNGTKAEWNAIEKNDLWDSKIGNYTIKCTDGEITKN